MTQEMTLLAEAVATMRTLQKQYFEAKQKNLYAAASQILPHAKAAEKKVDRMLTALKETPADNRLF